MRDKLISFDSCVSIFQPNLQKSFGTISPINSITGPAVPLLYSWAGSVSYTSAPSIAFGTIDRWRPDPNDPIPLNRDQWVLWSTGRANLIRVRETNKKDIAEHWSKSLPTEIGGNAPHWVKNHVNKMINSK